MGKLGGVHGSRQQRLSSMCQAPASKTADWSPRQVQKVPGLPTAASMLRLAPWLPGHRAVLFEGTMNTEQQAYKIFRFRVHNARLKPEPAAS